MLLVRSSVLWLPLFFLYMALRAYMDFSKLLIEPSHIIAYFLLDDNPVYAAPN